MTRMLPAASGWVLAAGLALLPVLAGRMFVADSLVVVGWTAGLLVLTGLTTGLRAGDRPRWRLDACDWALVVFAVLQIASAAATVYLFASLLYAANVVAGVTLFWVCRYGLRGGPWQRRALWGLVAGAAAVSVWGIREYVRTVFFLDQPEWRIFSTFYNPNCLAGYLLLAVFPAAALLFGAQTRAPASPTASPEPPATRPTGKGRDRRTGAGKRSGARRVPETADPVSAELPRYREIAAAFAALLMLVALLLTGSKAALGAILVGGVLFGVLAAGLTRRPWLVRGLSLAGAGLMLAAALALPPIRVRLVSAFGWQNHSMRFRLYTWQGAVEMVKARPWLGHGGGTFEWSFPRYAMAGYTRQAHQSFLQLAAECGIPALVAGLVWGMLITGRLGHGLVRGRPGLLSGLVRTSAVAALIASGVHALVDYAWYVPAVGAAFFALAGLALGLAGDDESPPAEAETRAVPRSPALGWVAVVLGAVLLTWTLTLARGEALGSRGDRLVAQGAYSAAMAAYTRAAQWSPLQARFAVQRAKVLEAMAQRQDADALARAVQARLVATKLQPTEAVNYLALSRLYAEAGDLTSAVAAAQEALRWYPRYPRGLAQLGDVQEEAGQDAAAIATYERLAELYDTPVGQCPAVTEMVETAYCYAWIALGDHARAEGRSRDADSLYGKAAAVVSWAIATESAFSEQLALAGEGSFGRVEENRGIAEQLAQRLHGREDPQALFRLAQLAIALGEHQEAAEMLERLAELPTRAQGVPETPRLRAWAVLMLARQMYAEGGGEEARNLAAKGLGMARGVQGKMVPGGIWWLPEDEAALNNLRLWAETYACGPMPGR